MEKVAQRIVIDQVELFTILATFEVSVNNVVSLFLNLSDTYNFTKEIKENLSKIYTDLKVSAHQLSLDPSTSSAHSFKIIYRTDLQEKMFEGRSQDKGHTSRNIGHDTSQHGCNAKTYCICQNIDP